MDAATKRRSAEHIRRIVTSQLKPFGLIRGKTSFWVRPQGHVIEFLHLHLFRFGAAFRVHAGLRVLNDTFEAAALNGPTSTESWTDSRKVYALEFTSVPSSLESCASDIVRFYTEVAEPWFARFRDPRMLLRQDSPLDESLRSRLELALQGSADSEAVRMSMRLLGVA